MIAYVCVCVCSCVGVCVPGTPLSVFVLSGRPKLKWGPLKCNRNSAGWHVHLPLYACKDTYTHSKDINTRVFQVSNFWGNPPQKKCSICHFLLSKIGSAAEWSIILAIMTPFSLLQFPQMPAEGAVCYSLGEYGHSLPHLSMPYVRWVI